MRHGIRIASVLASVLVYGQLIVCGLLSAGLAAGASDLYLKGMEKVEAEEWPAAVELLEQAVAAEPDNLRAGTEYRQAVIEAGEYDRSLAFFERLVAEHPKSSNLLLNYGYAHVDKIPVEGSITQVILANTALTHFSVALELEETWLGRYTRGNSYLYWPAIFGRTQLGIDDLERAIEMSKKMKRRAYHGRAWAALGDGYWRLEDLEKARQVYQQGLELYAETPELKERAALEGDEALNAYLEALFDTNKRVGTHLREIWKAHADD